MSNQRADRNAIDDLPDFLADATTTVAEAEAHSDPSADPSAEDADQLVAHEGDHGGAQDDEQAASDSSTSRASTSSGRRRDRLGGQRSGSTGTILAAILLLCAGAGLGLAQSQGHLTAASDYGCPPGTLLLAGVVCAVGASVRRQGAADQVLLAERVETEAAAGDEVREGLAYLVSAQQAQAQRPPAAGEELQRVLLTLERHDEKINNLTKAMKMYGKPLMEIANQVADISGAVNSTKSDVEAALDATREGFTRLASDGGDEDLKKEVEDVHQQIARLEEHLQKAFTGLGERLLRPDALHQLAERLESQLRSLANRIDDTSRQQTQAVEKVARLDPGPANEKMTQQFEAAIQRLRTDLENLKAANLGALETCVREIHREITGIATATSQMQQALKSGGGRAAHAAQPAAAQSAGAQHAAPTAASPAAAPASAAKDGAGSSTDAQSGVAQNQTGTRATSSKNVLGAIAKLKQMKS